MSIKHTSTRVGTKPLEAIVAEFAADLKTKAAPRPPDDRPGWIESRVLMQQLNMTRSSFERFIYPRKKAGLYELGRGTVIDSRGVLNVGFYYRRADNAPKVAQIAPLAPKPAKRGA